MSDKTIILDIVSAEAEVYSGEVSFIAVTGSMGELGIHPGHTALITPIKPGQVVITVAGSDEEQVFYISGGVLEVQPKKATILTDTAIRAGDLDESAAVASMERAEKALSDQQGEMEYSTALSELAEAAAQLRAIQSLRSRAKK